MVTDVQYTKCRGCEGCKPYMLDDTDPKNNICGGSGYKRADGKSQYDLQQEAARPSKDREIAKLEARIRELRQ